MKNPQGRFLPGNFYPLKFLTDYTDKKSIGADTALYSMIEPVSDEDVCLRSECGCVGTVSAHVIS